MFFIENSEVCICRECGSLLKYRDKVLRGQKQIGDEKYTVLFLDYKSERYLEDIRETIAL